MSASQLLLPPTESQIPKILTILREDSQDRLDQNVKLFEEWIKCTPYLPQNYEKQSLVTFVRGSKHDLEAAKRKFLLLAMGKRTLTQIFANRDLSDPGLLKIWQNFCIVPLPKLTKGGERVTLFKLRNLDLDRFDPVVLQKITWIFADYRINREPLSSGEVFVFDSAIFSAAHCSKFLTVLMKETLRLVQEAFPFRIAAIHVVNASPYLDTLINAVKLFFKEKLRKRFHVYKGIDYLKESVGTEVLPFEYGGDEERLDDLEAKWKDQLFKNNDLLEVWANLKCSADVPKDITDNCNFQDGNLGIQGSFRKLNLD